MTKKVNKIVKPNGGPNPEAAMGAAVAQRISSLRKAQDLTFDARNRVTQANYAGVASDPQIESLILFIKSLR